MRASGGEIPRQRRDDDRVMVMLSPGEVWCAECDWHYVGGTDVERMHALSTHDCRP